MAYSGRVVDMHAHTVAPPELYQFKANLLSSRGYGDAKPPSYPDERVDDFAKRNIAIMDSVGTDIQFLSPRPFQLMNSEKPAKIVDVWCQANNNVIAQQVRLHPDRFRGVAGLPFLAGEHHGPGSLSLAIEELERCVNEMGFIGCLINPDLWEGTIADGAYSPNMGDEYWYPLYEKMVELGVPGHIHTAGCKNGRESYSNHFITEGSIALLGLVNSNVYKDFPNLKIVVSHGGGSVPYQIGRWQAARWMHYGPEAVRFEEDLHKLYFDTVLYTKESLDLLFKICGTDRCMFGTEKPGSGSGQDPQTGLWKDDTKPVIDSIEWLSDEDKKNIFDGNVYNVFPRFKV